tara:strand:+ start:1834 stop:3075 length:1242 start_codon:yes stop_codon:yes gene_type:complete
MKKLSCLLLFFVFLVSSVSAISTDMEETYNRGETIIVEILGNILQPIVKEDVIFLRGHVQVPIYYDVKRIGNRHYIYGIAPMEENNYTLKINNLLTTIEGVNNEIDFEQNFSITNTLIDYSINPGFAIFEKDFEFTMVLNEDLDKSISIDFPEEGEIILTPGENKLKISSITNETGFKIIQIGNYKIPIFILESSTEPEITFKNLTIFPQSIESILLFGQTKVYPVRVKNHGTLEIDNLKLNYNFDIFEIDTSQLNTISPNETVEFNITLKTSDNSVFEIISFEIDEYYEELIINITYTEDANKTETPYLDNYAETQKYYCSELSGKSCSADEQCSTEVVQTIDVTSCCIGECNIPEEGGFAWIGILIGLVILVVLIIVGIRYKKSKEKPDVLKRQVVQAKKSNPILSLRKNP